jgi:curli biogenesis system outer membrane secretion channel CsgG
MPVEKRLRVVTALVAVTVLGGCTTAPSESSYSPPAAPVQVEVSGWQAYADPDGDSSVAAYEIGDDYVRVRFSDGSVYLYTYASAGASHVERMKELARSGDGLNSYIMNNVKYDYESKQR